MTDSFELGGNVKLSETTEDEDGNAFIATDSRLSVQDPTSSVFTVSGEGMVLASGEMSYLYTPFVRGFYNYEFWWVDPSGREFVTAHGFDITDYLVN